MNLSSGRGLLKNFKAVFKETGFIWNRMLILSLSVLPEQHKQQMQPLDGRESYRGRQGKKRRKAHREPNKAHRASAKTKCRNLTRCKWRMTYSLTTLLEIVSNQLKLGKTTRVCDSNRCGKFNTRVRERKGVRRLHLVSAR